MKAKPNLQWKPSDVSDARTIDMLARKTLVMQYNPKGEAVHAVDAQLEGQSHPSLLELSLLIAICRWSGVLFVLLVWFCLASVCSFLHMCPSHPFAIGIFTCNIKHLAGIQLLFSFAVTYS